MLGNIQLLLLLVLMLAQTSTAGACKAVEGANETPLGVECRTDAAQQPMASLTWPPTATAGEGGLCCTASADATPRRRCTTCKKIRLKVPDVALKACVRRRTKAGAERVCAEDRWEGCTMFCYIQLSEPCRRDAVFPAV